MIFQILTSACLFYLSFPNIFSLHGFSFLSWVFAIPFFFCMEGRNLTGRITAGFLFGLLANFAAVNWMTPYSFPGYVLLSLALASQAVIFAVFYRRVSDRNVLNVLYVAAAWVAAEYLRKIIMFGESWNLAHSQTFNFPLMQISGLLGSSAISFLLIFVNYSLYQFLKYRSNFKMCMSVMLWAGILLVWVYGYGLMRLAIDLVPAKKSLKICVLQTAHDYHGELTEQRIRAILEDNINLTRRAVAENGKPDLIIWPETAIPTDFLEDPALRQTMEHFVKDINTYVLVGAALHDNAGQHNSAVLLDKGGTVQQIYHKRHLIPLTEFIPDAAFWKTFAKLFRVETPDLVEGKANESGIMQITRQNKETVRFGVAICSEDNIDSLFREYYRNGAQFVVVLLNNGWFTQPAGSVMHAQHSIVRAMENRFSVFRSSNQGWSGWIDEVGNIRDESMNSLGQKRFFYYEMFLRREKSPFNNLGDTFCVLCVCFVILMALTTTKWKNMIRCFVLVILSMFVFVNSAHAGAAVAMQNKKKAGGHGPAGPPQLPPGYVMTPSGVQKISDMQPPEPEEPAELVKVEDVVDLEHLTASLQTSSEAWEMIINEEDKEIVVEQFINQYADQGVTIKKPAELYVGMIDQMSKGNPSMLAMPFDQLLRVVTVMEYDFGNGQNPDLLAQKILGQAYEKNKQRLTAEMQGPRNPADKDRDND